MKCGWVSGGGGKLAARPAEVGQRVKAGQLLAQLDAADYQLASQAAQAQVQAATTSVIWRRRISNATPNCVRRISSAVPSWAAKPTLKAAQASLDQAKAQGGCSPTRRVMPCWWPSGPVWCWRWRPSPVRWCLPVRRWCAWPRMARAMW